MIEISDGFTRISAGFDSIESVVPKVSRQAFDDHAPRAQTGARVTVEFRCQSALAPGQCVAVRYDFAGDGMLREGMGIAHATQTVVRSGHAVVYHYRLSYWIAPTALAEFVTGNVRHRTEEPEIATQPLKQHILLVG